MIVEMTLMAKYDLAKRISTDLSSVDERMKGCLSRVPNLTWILTSRLKSELVLGTTVFG